MRGVCAVSECVDQVICHLIIVSQHGGLIVMIVHGDVVAEILKFRKEDLSE